MFSTLATRREYDLYYPQCIVALLIRNFFFNSRPVTGTSQNGPFQQRTQRRQSRRTFFEVLNDHFPTMLKSIQADRSSGGKQNSDYTLQNVILSTVELSTIQEEHN